MIETAHRHFEKRIFSETLVDIRNAAELQYKLINRVADSRLSGICISLADKIFSKPLNYEQDKNCFLFYDSFTWDNRGETQQYLDAILNLADIRLIFVNEGKIEKKSSCIYRQLKKHGVEHYELGNERDELEKIKRLRSIIENAKPGKAFFHLSPYSVIPFVAFGDFKGVIKYQINLTDHAFWLGDSSFFDYTFEFRGYGCNLSLNERSFKKDQILYLPYYPWIEETPFQGFPKETKGWKILFSGGSLYKIEGGEGKYYEALKKILDANPSLLFFYAGDGNRAPFYNFIRTNHFENRVSLLGNRSDIGEVIKRIDIYLGTYPMGGGLMTQYAAVYGKPLLIYKTKGIEEVVCIKRNEPFVFDNMDELVKESTWLVNNPEYYKERGAFFKSLIIEKEEFRNLFTKVLDGESPLSWEKRNVQIQNHESLYRINKDGFMLDKILMPYASPKFKLKILGNYICSIPYYYNRIVAAIKRRIIKNK